jgi:hypothetical protein
MEPSTSVVQLFAKGTLWRNNRPPTTSRDPWLHPLARCLAAVSHGAQAMTPLQRRCALRMLAYMGKTRPQQISGGSLATAAPPRERELALAAMLDVAVTRCDSAQMGALTSGQP